ncbi:hypothetical protein CBL_02390 [Carabus blaptoides fortunei]
MEGFVEEDSVSQAVSSDSEATAAAGDISNKLCCCCCVVQATRPTSNLLRKLNRKIQENSKRHHSRHLNLPEITLNITSNTARYNLEKQERADISFVKGLRQYRVGMAYTCQSRWNRIKSHTNHSTPPKRLGQVVMKVTDYSLD